MTKTVYHLFNLYYLSLVLDKHLYKYDVMFSSNIKSWTTQSQVYSGMDIYSGMDFSWNS